MSRVSDAIVWLGLGLCLIAQAAFLLLPVVLYDVPDGEAGARIALPESMLVGTGFLIVGLAVLWRGVRRVRTPSDTPVAERAFPPEGV